MKKYSFTLLFIVPFYASYSQPGSLDNTFNGNGKVFTSFYYDYGNGPEIMGQDGGSTIVVQPNGKILVGGGTYNGLNGDFGLLRYNTDGSLDNSFGVGGYISTGFGAGDINDHEGIVAIALQSDGKIVAVGTTISISGIGDYAMIRYNMDGSLDSSFGINGKVITDFGDVDEATSLAIQSDGKIIVGGFSLNGTDVDFSLARYNTDGSLDNSFDGDGKLISVFSPRYDYLYAIAIQTDGKIVVAGQSYLDFIGQFALARFNPDGSPDNTFDGDGKVVTVMGPSSEVIHAIGLQSDGKIVVAGYGHNVSSSNNDFMVARFLTNGSPDNTFDGDGNTATPISTGVDYAKSLAIQSNGQIIVAGYSFTGVLYDFSLVKYNTNGSLDNTFGTGGKVLLEVGGNDILGSMAITSGRIYITGTGLGIPTDGYYKISLVAFQNSSIALPLQLTNLTASIQNTSVLLQWKTVAEQTTSHFDIERSNDGIHFRVIGSTMAAGNSSVSKDYSFTDASPLTGTVFYRLKMADLDGAFTYSRIVAVKRNAISNQTTTLFPNPARDILHIQLNSTRETSILSVTDGAGKLWRKEKWKSTGVSSFSLDIAMLPAGQYYLVMQIDNHTEVHPFIKH